MWQLNNGVRYYDWGSRTVIPELLGEPVPADRPYAELWVGAHPDESSVLADGRALDRAIDADPKALLALPGKARTGLVRAGAGAAAGFVAAHAPEFINTYRWGANLAQTYPGDAGVVISLLCNHLKLEPGEGVFLPAGNLHAYLSGAG